MREEKRSEVIQDAINFLDDEMIEEVEELRGNKFTEEKVSKYSWTKKWVAVAAGICLLVMIGGLDRIEFADIQSGDTHEDVDMQENAPSDDKEEEAEDVIDKDTIVDGEDTVYPESDYQSVTLPAYQVNLGKSEYYESDMALLFIYDGRCYVQTCDYMSKDVIGKYVCTTTGLIDEWTEKDGYVELAGSLEEDIYTIKGVDPEFMLCAVYDNGVVETFVHNNDISLSRGGEILEWLGFEVGQEEYASFCNKGNSCTTEVSEAAKEILDKFFANFAENEVLLRKDISATTNEEDIYHLVIVTEDNVPLQFELLNGGYVSYYGLNEVCVKVDQRVYELVVDVLERR